MSTAVTFPEGPTVSQSHSATLPLPLPSSRHSPAGTDPERLEVSPSPGIENLGHQVEPLILHRGGVVENVGSSAASWSCARRSGCDLHGQPPGHCDRQRTATDHRRLAPRPETPYRGHVAARRRRRRAADSVRIAGAARGRSGMRPDSTAGRLGRGRRRRAVDHGRERVRGRTAPCRDGGRRAAAPARHRRAGPAAPGRRLHERAMGGAGRMGPPRSGARPARRGPHRCRGRPGRGRAVARAGRPLRRVGGPVRWRHRPASTTAATAGSCAAPSGSAPAPRSWTGHWWSPTCPPPRGASRAGRRRRGRSPGHAQARVLADGRDGRGRHPGRGLRRPAGRRATGSSAPRAGTPGGPASRSAGPGWRRCGGAGRPVCSSGSSGTFRRIRTPTSSRTSASCTPCSTPPTPCSGAPPPRSTPPRAPTTRSPPPWCARPSNAPCGRFSTALRAWWGPRRSAATRRWPVASPTSAIYVRQHHGERDHAALGNRLLDGPLRDRRRP